MPSRTRIVFCDPFASMDAGRKVAHQGHRAYLALYRFACRCKDAPALYPPPGTMAQRATWLWAQIPKFQRAGAGLFLLKERRRQPWSKSYANPSALGLAWATPANKFKKAWYPSEFVKATLNIASGIAYGLDGPATASQGPSVSMSSTAETPYDSPWGEIGGSSRQKKPKRIAKGLRKAAKEAAPPKKRLQIGVWA